MLEMTTIPEEWLRELSEEDRARIESQLEPAFDEYNDEIEEY